MGHPHTSEANIRINPFWLDEVKKFAVVKFELNKNNRDLYFWTLDMQHLDADLGDVVDNDEVKEEKLGNLDKDMVISSEILVRIVGVDYNYQGTRKKYTGGALFYQFINKKWQMVARLNTIKYAQVPDKPHRRFRLGKPIDQIGQFDEVIGELPWDKPSSDFKPGLMMYHDEKQRPYREYAGILGSIMLYSEKRIIENEAIRYPVTHLKSLMDISFDLLRANEDGMNISALYLPK